MKCKAACLQNQLVFFTSGKQNLSALGIFPSLHKCQKPTNIFSKNEIWHSREKHLKSLIKHKMQQCTNINENKNLSKLMEPWWIRLSAFLLVLSLPPQEIHSKIYRTQEHKKTWYHKKNNEVPPTPIWKLNGKLKKILHCQ